jgi:sphingosine kinase
MSFNLIRATPKPMDLTRFQLADKSIVHSFLCLEWAIIADVDLESEKYRFLGGLRFAVGAIKRILSRFLLNVETCPILINRNYYKHK